MLIPGLDEQAAFTIDHGLTHTLKGCGDHGQAVRHRLQDHVGQAVAVAVGEPAAWESEHVGGGVFGTDLLLGQGAEEQHAIGERKLVDEPLQPRPLDTLARDPHHERRPAIT